jgi:hypothetical protein
MTKSRRMRWAGLVECKGEIAYNILDGKPEGKKPLGREVIWEGVNWIHLAQDRDQRRPLVNGIMKLHVS